MFEYREEWEQQDQATEKTAEVLNNVMNRIHKNQNFTMHILLIILVSYILGPSIFQITPELITLIFPQPNSTQRQHTFG